MQARRVSRGIAVPILDPGARRGRVDSVSPRPLYPRQRDPDITLQNAGWATWPYGWTWKISPPPVFQLRTVHSQQVVNTSWAIRQNLKVLNFVKSRLGSLTQFLDRLPCITQAGSTWFWPCFFSLFCTTA